MREGTKRRRRKLSARAVRDAIQKADGNIAGASRLLGVPRSSVYHYVQTRPSIRQLVIDCRETLLDDAESALRIAVLNGDPWAIRLVLLKTRGGRERGYGNFDKVEIAGGLTVSESPTETASSGEPGEMVLKVADYLDSIGAGRPCDRTGHSAT